MSDSLPARTLWRDEENGRQYLVPHDAELPPGPLLLRAGASGSASVDPAAAAPYEVTRAQARAYLDTRLDAWAASTSAALGEAFSLLGLMDEYQGPPPAMPLTGLSDEQPSPSGEPGPGLRLFAALSGQPAEKVANDPQAFVGGMVTMLAEMSTLMFRAAESPEGEAEARARMRQLGDTLRAHGISPPAPPPDEAD